MSVEQKLAFNDLVEAMVGLLPASFSTVTFGSVAIQLGLGHLLPKAPPGGKLVKRAVLRPLLSGILAHERMKLTRFVETVVGESDGWHKRKNEVLYREEIEDLNKALLAFETRIPTLWKASFLDRFPRRDAPTSTTAPVVAPPPRRTKTSLPALLAEFQELSVMTNRQQAGYGLEKLLNRLFEHFDLEPEAPFKIEGEQIDGAFHFDSSNYLLETKWADPVNLAALAAFDIKVIGKSRHTRGVFISINGYTSEAVPALTKGKSANMILLHGTHIYRVLSGHLSLRALLTKAVRHLDTRGEPLLPLTEL